MWDIIGYWSAVTVVCAFILYPWVFIGAWIAEWYITRITDGEKGKDLFKYWLGKLTFKDKFGLILEFMVAVISVWSFIVMSIVVVNDEITYIASVHNIVTKITPFFSTVTPVIVALFLMDKIIKKCYTYSKLLKKLEKENK